MPSNEFVHGSVGTTMTQAEFEAVGLHVFNSQATGDILYASSSTQLSRLAVGTNGQILALSSGIPAWSDSINGLSITNDGTKTTLLGTSGDYNRIGDNATTANSLDSEDDLMVTGQLEVSSTIYATWSINCERYLQLLTDDRGILLGAGDDVSLGYETTDVNAKALILGLPHTTEDGSNVPVFVIGDRNVTGVDLGFFDGITLPSLALINVARNAYVTLDSGDVNASGLGLYFKAAADENINILKCSVTGTPTLNWDETNNEFNFNQRVNATAYAAGGTDGADFGPADATSFTVVKGIITAIS